ncbi:MAG TPA: hypothetical protein VKA48_03370, partial [Gammaproteobacteria bacterium]|nr:hypothetical protein [Gammaproteobacteria bacterium]
DEHIDTQFVTVRQNDIVFDVVAKMRYHGAETALITANGKLGSGDKVIGILSLQDIASASHLTRQVLAGKANSERPVVGTEDSSKPAEHV